MKEKKMNQVFTIDRVLSNETEYLVCCISEFARMFNMKQHEAYAYLHRYLGIDYLLRHYNVLHTLSIDESVSDLVMVCKRNGGGLDENSSLRNEQSNI